MKRLGEVGKMKGGRRKDGCGNKFTAGNEGMKSNGDSCSHRWGGGPSKVKSTGPRLEKGELWDANLLLQLQVRYSSSSHYPRLLLSPTDSFIHSLARQCDGPAWLRTGSVKANDWI